MLASSKIDCRIDKCQQGAIGSGFTRSFQLASTTYKWNIWVRDELRSSPVTAQQESNPPKKSANTAQREISSGIELLLDVELEASVRFGCCELPLGEILELGPGDVVELDRHVVDPVDLIVGDKIIARGEVVVVNGNFGLRVTDVSAPRTRLEGIRCLF
jgi:flagellar motor switch protein FliN